MENVIFPEYQNFNQKQKVLRMVESPVRLCILRKKHVFQKNLGWWKTKFFTSSKFLGNSIFPYIGEKNHFSALPHNSKCETNPLLRKGHTRGGRTNEK